MVWNVTHVTGLTVPVENTEQLDAYLKDQNVTQAQREAAYQHEVADQSCENRPRFVCSKTALPAVMWCGSCKRHLISSGAASRV